MTAKLHLHRLGGVAPAAKLIDLGVSRHQLSLELKSGAIRAVRRGWVALPDADSQLFLAASTGTVLTCITQAKRLGLWVLNEDLPHLAAPHPHSEVRDRRGTIHWSRPILQRVPGTLVDPIENVLGLVAQCQPFESALAVWESALNMKLVDLQALEQLPFRGKARRLLGESQPFSDSGLETFVRVRLRWLRVSIEPQAWVHGHRVDFLIDGWLVLQIDGGHHVGAQRTEDIRHDAELMLRGYQVIRCSYEQVVHRWPEVQGVLQRALVRGPYPSRSDNRTIPDRSSRIGQT